MVYFNSVKLFDYSSMVEVFMYLVLSNGMLYVVVLDLLWPAVVKVMDFAGYLAAVLEVVGLIHLWVATFAKDT